MSAPYATLLDAVDAYTQCLRRVIDEDRAAIEHANVAFNLHATARTPANPTTVLSPKCDTLTRRFSSGIRTIYEVPRGTFGTSTRH